MQTFCFLFFFGKKQSFNLSFKGGISDLCGLPSIVRLFNRIRDTKARCEVEDLSNVDMVRLYVSISLEQYGIKGFVIPTKSLLK